MWEIGTITKNDIIRNYYSSVIVPPKVTPELKKGKHVVKRPFAENSERRMSRWECLKLTEL